MTALPAGAGVPPALLHGWGPRPLLPHGPGSLSCRDSWSSFLQSAGSPPHQASELQRGHIQLLAKYIHLPNLLFTQGEDDAVSPRTVRKSK